MQSVTSNAVAEEINKTRFSTFLRGEGTFVDILPLRDVDIFAINYGYRNSTFMNFGFAYYFKPTNTVYVGFSNLVVGQNWVNPPTVSMVNGKIRITHTYGDSTYSLITRV